MQRFGVDGGDDGEVVLELVEVLGRCGDGVVEGVGEGGVEGAEGELVDCVGEVEGWRVLAGVSVRQFRAAYQLTVVI